uniref:Asparagine-rich protein n=1 Tax=Margaritifera margaritifera TaxID=102329 RepID=NRP_PINMG|nr:RecName: Full=Asparagine-rich protein; AltName: Full=Prism uncharacterized shell protein 1; Short=PUSP1; Flags: Precursor [Pinctada margaritifera]CCE46161.1 prism uncharacterized shell protein 1 [Pinctada margaritifera]
MKGTSALLLIGFFHATISQDPGGTVVIGSLSGRKRGNLNTGGQITSNSAILGDVNAGSKLSEPPKRRNTDKTARMLENNPRIGGSLIPPPGVIMEPNPYDINPPYFVSNKNSQSTNSATNTMLQSLTSDTKTTTRTSQTSSTRASSSITQGINTMNRNSMRFNQVDRNKISGFVNSGGQIQTNPLNTNSQSSPILAAQRQITRQKSENTQGNSIVRNGGTNSLNIPSSTRRSQPPNMAVQIGQNTATFNMGTDGKVLHKFLPTNLFENINSVSKEPRNTASVPGIGGMRNPGPSISIRNIFGTNNIEGSSVQLTGSSGVFVSDPGPKGNPTDVPQFVPSGISPTVRDPNALDPFKSIRNQIVPDIKRNEVNRGNSMISAPVIDNPTNSNSMVELNSILQNVQNGFLSEALGNSNNQNNRVTNIVNQINSADPQPVRRCQFLPYRDLRTNKIDRRYFRQLVNGKWLNLKCADGAGFNETTCLCSIHLTGDAQCSPEVRLNFNDGTIQNLTPINVHIDAEGVDASKGWAHFNGSTQMKFEYFNAYDVQRDFLIKLRFKADSYIPNQSHPIVTNCVAGQENTDPSIGVFLTGNYPHKIVFILQTDKSKLLQHLIFDVPRDGWHDITYKYDGSTLTGILDGKEKSLPTEGRIENRQAVLVFGGCGNRIFRGNIDDIQIYTCIPPSHRNKG